MSSIRQHIWTFTPSDYHRDHVADCVVIGNAIARFHEGRRAPTTSLTILPLKTAKG
jgi:hypothetical protein